MIEELFRGFQAQSDEEAAIAARVSQFVASHGQAAIGREVVGEAVGESGHLTAAAWITNPQSSQVLLVFGVREGVWRLPGAHCDGDSQRTAQNEAARALGRAPETLNPSLQAVAEREIEEYWQTPAHRHFELIFGFTETQSGPLPRGARWFSMEEAAQLGDASLSRLSAKNQRDS